MDYLPRGSLAGLSAQVTNPAAELRAAIQIFRLPSHPHFGLEQESPSGRCTELFLAYTCLITVADTDDYCLFMAQDQGLIFLPDSDHTTWMTHTVHKGFKCPES